MQGPIPQIPVTIAKRRDFLAASRARKSVPHSSMIVQGRARRDGEPIAVDLVRVGYTCSKKVGNAVARNRAKRRPARRRCCGSAAPWPARLGLCT